MADVPTFGLTHLVSISGLHVTMVAVLAGWLVKTDFQTTALDTGKTARVDFGGRRGRGFVLCAAGRFFCADAAKRLDVGSVCLGLVARQSVFGLDGVVAGFGGGGVD